MRKVLSTLLIVSLLLANACAKKSSSKRESVDVRLDESTTSSYFADLPDSDQNPYTILMSSNSTRPDDSFTHFAHKQQDQQLEAEMFLEDMSIGMGRRELAESIGHKVASGGEASVDAARNRNGVFLEMSKEETASYSSLQEQNVATTNYIKVLMMALADIYQVKNLFTIPEISSDLHLLHTVQGYIQKVSSAGSSSAALEPTEEEVNAVATATGCLNDGYFDIQTLWMTFIYTMERELGSLSQPVRQAILNAFIGWQLIEKTWWKGIPIDTIKKTLPVIALEASKNYDLQKTVNDLEGETTSTHRVLGFVPISVTEHLSAKLPSIVAVAIKRSAPVDRLLPDGELNMVLAKEFSDKGNCKYVLRKVLVHHEPADHRTSNLYAIDKHGLPTSWTFINGSKYAPAADLRACLAIYSCQSFAEFGQNVQK